jgi:predicted dehydrogenase
MKKINLGIISPGEHFARNILPALSKISSIEIVAIYSKKKNYNLIKSANIYDNLNSFLKEKNIDVVYISSPNSFHFNHAIKSLKNNKHVICEKPLVTSIKEFKKLLRLSKKNKKFLFEAFMFQYHLQFETLKKLINKKKIGKIISINASFCYPHKKKKDIRYYKKLGGGAFLDAGCYLFKLSSLIFNNEPSKVILEKYISPKYEVDTYGSCQLFYKKGFIANLEWGIGFKYINQLQILTNNSSLLLDKIFSKKSNEVQSIKIFKGDKKLKVIKLNRMNHFIKMFENYLKIIKKNNFIKYSLYLKELSYHQNFYLKIYSRYYK